MASALPRYSLTPVALKFLTAGVSTSPAWSGNVIGELSSGLLKSDRSPALAGDRPNPPVTSVSPNSDRRGSERKTSGIDRNSNLFGFLKRHRPLEVRAMLALRRNALVSFCLCDFHADR